MKVLVTGGCGFIGSHVCEYYHKMGWEVVSFDNMTKYELKRTGYNTDLARMHNWEFLDALGIELMKEDIRNFENLLKAADGCDYIIHTAAQPAMTLSIENPHLGFTTNVAGTYNVLEVARRFKIPVVSCASIHVYGTDINKSITEGEKRYTRNPVAIDEKHPTMRGDITPLHASKKSAENYVRAFIDTYDLKAASFRLTGLYGPRQFGGEDHGWIANFAIRALRNEPITIFNSGKQVRDILYASDVCKAFHAFFENQVPGIYNIGGGIENSISLLESVEYLARLLGKQIDYSLGGERFGDLYYFVSDTQKAKQKLGWQSEVRPYDGIKFLVDWIKDNMEIFKS